MWKIKSDKEGKNLLFLWRVVGAAVIHLDHSKFESWNMVKFHTLPFPSDDYYKIVDIRKGLKYQDNSFDGIYAFHISEHLTWHENNAFVKELWRILCPGGICRLSTPDLYEKAIEYIKRSEAYEEDNNLENKIRFNWSIYGLIDQVARTESGGHMMKSVKSGFFDRSYLRSIYGDVFEYFCFNDNQSVKSKDRKGIRYFGYGLIRRLIRIFSNSTRRNYLENERFYFDQISFKRLMEDCQFQNVSIKTYKDSDIPNWDKYQLDTSEKGDYPLEPSCYVEGTKR